MTSKPKTSSHNLPLLRFALSLMVATAAMHGEEIFVGFNTLTPVQVYETSGNYVQDFGPAGAIAAFPIDSAGDYYAVNPSSDFTSSTVSEYNSNSSSMLSSFSVNDLITSAALVNGNLFLSAYDGTIYQVSTSGSILSSWSTGFTHVGVTSDGTNIYTTEGDSGNLIDVWSMSGTKTGSIATGFTGLYGLGYDSLTGDFWAGSTDYVYELSSSGATLNTLNIMGDSRTPDGAVHDSIFVGDLPSVVATPEPASLFCVAAGLIALGLFKRRRIRRFFGAATTALTAAAISYGAVSVKLTPSVSSGAAVGTPVTWTASATDTTNSNATFTYQFSAAPYGSPLQVRRDYYFQNTFTWTPTDSEGMYDIQVVALSSTGASGSATAAFNVSSRVTGSSPVISPTQHPLVALYSMPACPAGRTARVRFRMPSATVWQATPTKNCTGGTSLNFYVAGMRASTIYEMQQDVYNGPFDTMGPVLNFTTGAIPSSLGLAPYSIVKPEPAPNDTAYPVLLFSPFLSLPYATDSAGEMIWYLPPQSTTVYFLTRPVAGGNFLVILVDDSHGGVTGSILREFDVAGNVVRETNYGAISNQLAALGDDPISAIHHEAIRLPNGWTALLGSSERVENQGSGPVDVIGDQVVVIDSNLRVQFYWNEFDHLNVNRPPVLGETCAVNQLGCNPVTLPGYTIANDWTHSNALFLAPDGNMIVSARHQDWILKFQYANGTGNGALLWTLGKGGDFSVSSSDPYPWFSHQHDTEFEPNGNLSLFDNGNTRIAETGGHSRGQVWILDEAHKVATLKVNLDLGTFSTATGSMELLSNGNYAFDLGFANDGQDTQMQEYTPSNAVIAEQDSPVRSYRSFRMRSLYTEQ